jgi:hypothetical protein
VNDVRSEIAVLWWSCVTDKLSTIHRTSLFFFEIAYGMHAIRSLRRFIALSCFTASIVALSASWAAALDIVLNHRGAGAPLEGVGTAGAQGSNVVGGGDFSSIVRAAADVWEDLILDNFTSVIDFGWHSTAPISPTAYYQPISAGGNPQRPTRGSIVFNNDPASGRRWFLDPSPLDDDEFGPLLTSRTDFGAGLINTRRHRAPVDPDAVGSDDLFSTAMHEIGHALGMVGWSFFASEVADGDVDLTIPPFAGSTIPIATSTSHISISGPLMTSRGHPLGYRREITDADLLAVSQVSRFTQYVLPPRTDWNGDRLVDGDDLAVWRAEWNAFNGADGDGDGDSDGADFLAWQQQLGSGPAVPVAGTVPEPKGRAIQLTAALAAWLYRPRRREARS